MEQKSVTKFENVIQEHSSITLLSSTDPEFLEVSKFADHEKNKIRNLALEELFTQRISKGSVGVSN